MLIYEKILKPVADTEKCYVSLTMIFISLNKTLWLKRKRRQWEQRSSDMKTYNQL